MPVRPRLRDLDLGGQGQQQLFLCRTRCDHHPHRLGARAGVKVDMGEKLAGEFSAGWLREAIDDNRLEANSGASVNADLKWSPERGTIIGLSLFVGSLVGKHDDLKRASLIIFAAVALLALPTFFSGIGGFEVIEREHRNLIEKGPGRISPFFIPATIVNLASGQVSIRLGAKGPKSLTFPPRWRRRSTAMTRPALPFLYDDNNISRTARLAGLGKNND